MTAFLSSEKMRIRRILWDACSPCQACGEEEERERGDAPSEERRVAAFGVLALFRGRRAHPLSAQLDVLRDGQVGEHCAISFPRQRPPHTSGSRGEERRGPSARLTKPAAVLARLLVAQLLELGLPLALALGLAPALPRLALVRERDELGLVAVQVPVQDVVELGEGQRGRALGEGVHEVEEAVDYGVGRAGRREGVGEGELEGAG